MKIKKFRRFEQPFFGVIQILHRCMYKCKMCNMWLGKETPEEITIEQAMDFSTKLGEIARKDFEFNILGGETLMKKDLEKLIPHVNSLGMRPIVSTNGYLISKEKSQSLYDSGLVHFTMSLDSLRPKIHDFYRGFKGSFDHVRKALTNLHSVYQGKQFVCIVAIIMKHNYKELLELANWVKNDPRVCSISFLALTNPCWTFDKNWHEHKSSKELWPNKSDYPKLSKMIDELIKFKQKNDHLIVNSIEQFEAFKEYYKNGPQNPITYNYNKFKGYVMVKSDGVLSMAAEKLGNIKKDDIRDLWFSKTAEEARKKIESKNTSVEIIINCKHGFEAY
ncbi:radical SAM protein [archaeon]|jgi:MoaA/NifB/PqqE/SkfB family radical SAM enzyme|nr:radical SAM protein [archaeon]